MRLAAYWDDAHLVDHFVADGNEIAGLTDLVVTAIPDRHHRVRNAPRNAPIVQTEVLVSAERPVRNDVAAEAPRDTAHALLRLCRQRRHLAIGRIDDEPRPAVPALEGSG